MSAIETLLERLQDVPMDGDMILEVSPQFSDNLIDDFIGTGQHVDFFEYGTFRVGGFAIYINNQFPGESFRIRTRHDGQGMG